MREQSVDKSKIEIALARIIEIATAYSDASVYRDFLVN
jgi:hypothetical protein